MMTEEEQVQEQVEIEKVEDFARRWPTYTKDSHWEDVDEFVRELLAAYLDATTTVNRLRKTSAYKSNTILTYRERLREANEIIADYFPEPQKESRWKAFWRGFWGTP